MATEPDQYLDPEEMKAAVSEWLLSHPDLPPLVIQAMESYLQLLDTLDVKSRKTQKLLRELRQSFGIVPKSEKRSNYGKKSTGLSKRASLEAQIADLAGLKKKHGRHMRKSDKKMKDLKYQLKELDEIELSEADLKAQAAEDKIFDEALALGGGRKDLVCSLPAEELFTGLAAEHEYVEQDCLLSEEEKQGSKRVFFEERTRLDLQISVSSLVLNVEKAELPNKKIISASTREHGPKGMMVTWNFLSQMSVLVAQYGMPMTRLATLLSTQEQEITSDRICRYFNYVASRLSDIYLHEFNLLAESDILSGDDTTTRTLEVARALKQELPEPPWQDFSTRELAEKVAASKEDPSLRVKIGSEIDFVSLAKQKPFKPKKQFNTTLIHGRSVEDEPKSTIVFFRSHFGSFGDLVSQLLARRSKENTRLWLVSDLATTNLVNDKKFEITQSGCTAHARRRFAKSEDGCEIHKNLCLDIFAILYTHEKFLDLLGRNIENTKAVRQKSSAPLWNRLKEDCEELVKTNSASTRLGEAARYILGNFEALTAHLKDPRIPHTNDLSERC